MKSYLIKKDQNGNKIIQKPINNINNESASWESVFPFYNSVTSIGDSGLYYAFYECTELTGSVSFPNLTSIGVHGLWDAFYSCVGLTSVSFPNLTDIGRDGLDGTFYGCAGLKEVHFKSSLSGNSQCTASNMGCTNATIYFDL